MTAATERGQRAAQKRASVAKAARLVAELGAVCNSPLAPGESRKDRLRVEHKLVVAEHFLCDAIDDLVPTVPDGALRALALAYKTTRAYRLNRDEVSSMLVDVLAAELHTAAGRCAVSDTFAARLRKLADLIEQHNLNANRVEVSLYNHEVTVDTPADLIAWADALGETRVRAVRVSSHGYSLQLYVNQWSENDKPRIILFPDRIPGMVIPPSGWTFHVDLLRIAEAVKAA